MVFEDIPNITLDDLEISYSCALGANNQSANSGFVYFYGNVANLRIRLRDLCSGFPHSAPDFNYHFARIQGRKYFTGVNGALKWNLKLIPMIE